MSRCSNAPEGLARPSPRRLRLFLAAAACALVCGACRSTRAESRSTPNIVVLYTDDQGYGDCSALNPEAKFVTPNMDRLAREGIAFTDAHSGGSVCTPSRYALLTGRYAWRTPKGARVLGADADCMIEDGRATLATLARAQGYTTAAFGKWHLGMQIPGTRGERDWTARVTDGPLQKGFDTFYGIPASMNFGVLTWFDGDRACEPAALWTRKKFPSAEITTPPLDYRMAPPYDEQRLEPSDIEVAASFADVDVLRITTEHAVRYIDSHAGEPFFVYVAFTAPHLPHCTAPEFRGKSGMGNYGDFVLETDHRVGQILAALERNGLGENTLVVFTSDNGPENNYHDWLRLYGHSSAGGLRGGKRDVYEGGHRVPFLVRWPSVVSPGRTSNEPIGQVDLIATLAELWGVELAGKAGEDSFSFLPQLLGEAARERPPLIHQGRGQYAVRAGPWKLIFAREKGGRGPPEELFDLERDPAERTNVLAEHPDITAALTQQADELLAAPPR